MTYGFITVIFASVCLVQVATANCINSAVLSVPSCGNSYSIGNGCSGTIGYGGNSGSAVVYASGSGGSSSFPVVSTSQYAPSGISVSSQNEIVGDLTVSGALPFASAVAFESAVPTGGEASVNYGCGSGVSLNSAGVSGGAIGSGSGIGLGSGVGLGSSVGLGSGIGLGYGIQQQVIPSFGSSCGCRGF